MMESSHSTKKGHFCMSLPDVGNVSQLKGILKTTSDPVMLRRVEEVDEGDEEGEQGSITITGNGSANVRDNCSGKFVEISAISLSSIEDLSQQNGPTRQCCQQYENPAYVEDEFHLKDDVKHFADVVEHITGEIAPVDSMTDLHPFGRNTLFEEILGPRTKDSSAESGIVIIWVLFVVCLLGMAGGIIFLAEQYELDKAAHMNDTSEVTN